MNKSLEALGNIKIDMEYITRLDFVEPIVRGEVQQSLYKIYHRETPELEIIEEDLKALEAIRKKGVFVHLLQQSKNVEEYNSLMIIAFKKTAERDYQAVVEKFCLTQEEFDSLKEVLL